jgi:signal transduction histidine kinase
MLKADREEVVEIVTATVKEQVAAALKELRQAIQALQPKEEKEVKKHA